MALISCPECGKDVSDKSEACIHCGYPLINTKCNINGVIYDFKEELPIALLEDTNKYVPAIGKIRKKTYLHLADAHEFVKIIRETKSIPDSFSPKYPLTNMEQPQEYSKNYSKEYGSGVQCPYCHSYNTSKISNFSKAVGFALLGVYSISRNGKQWHCGSCGSDF